MSSSRTERYPDGSRYIADPRTLAAQQQHADLLALRRGQRNDPEPTKYDNTF